MHHFEFQNLYKESEELSASYLAYYTAAVGLLEKQKCAYGCLN
jgi:hypothetical protein